MKKLITIAMVALAAVAANAASTSWKVTVGKLSAYDGSSFTTYTGSVLIFASGGDLASEIQVAKLTPTSGSISGVIFSTDKLTVGQEYSFTYKLASSGYELVSSAKPGVAIAVGEPGLNWGSQQEYTQTPGNWSAAPEPTSGIMLLLGVGLMALKRKRV